MKTYQLSYRTSERWHHLGYVKAKTLAGALKKAAILISEMSPTPDAWADSCEIAACIMN